MKHVMNKSILLEVSQRELEMISTALSITSSYWQDRADNTLSADEFMKALRQELSDRYDEMANEADEILSNLPF